jgi:hypothetical protein
VEQIDSHLPSLLLQTESAIQSSNFQTKPFSILSCIALRAITLDGLYSFYSFTLSYVPRSATVARKEREREIQCARRSRQPTPAPTPKTASHGRSNATPYTAMRSSHARPRPSYGDAASSVLPARKRQRASEKRPVPWTKL